MSSSAKRLVQTLRGRNNNGSGGRGNSSRSDSRDSYDGGGGGGGCGGASHSTSATRLFQYDSGHELDEISVIGSRSPGITGDEPTTPTTPYHSGNATVGAPGMGYGSRQTLYSIAGSVPATAHGQHLPRITPSGELS
ncbi:hypothetical protein QAD02_016346 [Eretmocerus hayati]|uniref:Uncharacterized protein n=1 Tax=Eretmocerus hayati TaxID=131215 RepID=A0ACC2PAB3_9HYME|nr:hypothetical protein QAD02_016346 [Eretmocerus hayati]